MTEKSILTEIKKMLGISEDYTAFDTDIIIYINSALSRLLQLGIVPNSGSNFQITGNSEKWTDLFNNDSKLNQIQTFIYLKVKMTFDPPSSATTLQSFENQIKELEWLLNVTIEEKEVI